MNKIKILLVTVLLLICVVTPKSVEATTVSDMDRIEENFRKYLIGEQTSNNLPIAKKKLQSIEKAGIAAMNEFEIKQDSVFKNIIISNVPGAIEKTVAELSQGLQNSFAKVNAIALAYSTDFEDNTLYLNKDALEVAMTALVYLYENYYENQDLGYYGNWYNWEIGVPLHLTKTLLLLEDEINFKNSSFIPSAIESMDLYLRNGIDGDVDLTYRNYTGANLFDITFNRIIHGALLDNEQRITKAFSDMMTVFDTIDPNDIKNGVTDGYYEDGSILQHSSVAYTGSYGAVLLERIAQTVTVLSGTKWQNKHLLDTVQLWIYTAFSPIIFEGYMMEIVKGRAASRTATGYVSNRAILEAYIELSNGLTGKDKDKLLSHIKYVAESSPSPVSFESFKSLQNTIAFNDLMSNKDIVGVNAVENEAHFAYNLMDKTVHLRDEFAFSISKSSNRVSKYEYMSGENMRSWFQGDGVFYLYLAGTDHNKEYGVDFFTTVDHYKLPGTTTPNEIRKTMRELYGAQFFEDLDYDMYSSSVKQNQYVYFPLGTNNYSGGVSHGKYGISSMQLGDEPSYLAKERGELPDSFVTYRNADANKSWFMFDDQIVALGSNISDVLDRDLTTTYDNRMYDVDDKLQVIGDVNKDRSLTIHSTKQNSTVSYVFLDDNAIDFNMDNRSESLKYIRENNPDTVIDKQYATITTQHDGKSVSDYSYVILPNTNDIEREEFIDSNSIVVLENNENIHVVRHEDLNLTGYSSFSNEESKVGDITTLSKMIMMREGNNFSVTDPTHEADYVRFEIEGRYNANSDKVDTTIIGKNTIVTINTKYLNGLSINFDLVTNEDPQTVSISSENVTVTYVEGQLPFGTILEVIHEDSVIVDGLTNTEIYKLSFKFEGKEVEPIGDVNVLIGNLQKTLDGRKLFKLEEGEIIEIKFESTDLGIMFNISESGNYAIANIIELDDKPIAPDKPQKPDESDLDKPTIPLVPDEIEDNKDTLPSTGIETNRIYYLSGILLTIGLVLTRRSRTRHN